MMYILMSKLLVTTWANLETFVSGVLTTFFFHHQLISQRVVRTYPGSIWTQGVQLLLEGVHTSISKENYSHLCFLRGGGSPPVTSLDLPMDEKDQNLNCCVCTQCTSTTKVLFHDVDIVFLSSLSFLLF